MDFNENLAIFGGAPVIASPLKRYNSIGAEELKSAISIIESGRLSQFIGAAGPNFEGGPTVKDFEKESSKYFDAKHAISVNSWTSGLICAVGAIGIEPGDEVIVSPWTMSASAIAILHWNAIPVFADIDINTFNIDPLSVENNISENTKAILAVDIFGLPANYEKLRNIADKYQLKIISDSAQSPGAKYKGRHTATLADIGGYSLNYHKHIHTGEGGIILTDCDDLAIRLKLIRNHAESVVGDMGISDISNMLGYNFRLGEIESAIGIQQLKKLPNILNKRVELAMRLIAGISQLDGITVPLVPEGLTHAYYVVGLKVDSKMLGISSHVLSKALQAEGVPVSSRYQNIHLLPIFQNKIAYGKSGFPWVPQICKREISYRKGICPNAEYLNDGNYLGIGMCNYDFDDSDIDMIISAFKKVWGSISNLRILR